MADYVEERWLLVDITAKCVRIAAATPSRRPVLGPVTSLDVENFATFTDVLLAFQRDTGIPLKGARCALSMGGATSGEAISIARSRWTVSRSGLASIFGLPASLLNDVATMGWALLGASPPGLEPLGPAGRPDLTRHGRWAVVSLDDGVGLAAINVDQTGVAQVLECEAGHGGFSPEDASEDRLHQALRKVHGRVTWEQVITLSVDDPIWAIAGLTMPRDEKCALRHRVIGSFVGDAVMSLGAWNGAFLTGKFAADLRLPAAQQLFNKRFECKRFQRLLQAAPRWVMRQQDFALVGAATLLAHRYGQD